MRKFIRELLKHELAADEPISFFDLAGANTFCVKRALAALFGGVVDKDVVSHTWPRVRLDWDAWNKRDVADESIVRQNRVAVGPVACLLVCLPVRRRNPTARCWCRRTR